MRPHGNPTRRSFLLGAAAAALPAAMPWRVLAQPAVGRALIDVHHHWYDAQLLRSWGRDTFDPNWTLAASLAGMDEAGVSTAILSVTMPGIWKGSDVPGSVKLARECNEGMARAVADHPGRLGCFAALPLPQVDASLAEIGYALDVLRTDGIGLLSSYDGLYLGDPRFAPVLDELNRRQATLYIHPMAPGCCTGLVPGVGPGALEAPTDTARTVESLLVTGTLSRLTGIRIIVGAGGGTLPFVGDRLISAATQAGKSAAEADKAYFTTDALKAALARLYLDTAGMTNLADWAALIAFTNASQLLFGSDWPFNSDSACLGQLRAMEQHYGMTASESQAIEFGNAQRLFPARFKPARA
jgi:predicted TIM-barrel fold metal-dependent hydrolase